MKVYIAGRFLDYETEVNQVMRKEIYPCYYRLLTYATKHDMPKTLKMLNDAANRLEQGNEVPNVKCDR